MQAFKSYGINKTTGELSGTDKIIEEIELYGISVIPNFIGEEQSKVLAEEVKRIYAIQEKDFGKENLAKINERNVARMCLVESGMMADLACHKPVMDVVKKLLGEYFILHLQNGIINEPKKEHNQSSWHRDLPYQNFISSVPLGINAFYCLTPFNAGTGGTMFLPASHKMDKLPSLDYIQKHLLQPELPAGSVILFNSMVFHSAGYNSSNDSRIGINHVYVTPIIRQQIDLPRALKGKYSDRKDLSYLLGYETPFAENVHTYRENRLNRM